MRKGYKFESHSKKTAFRSDVDSTSAEFAETMRYSEIGSRLKNENDFYNVFPCISWIEELHISLGRLLQKERKILGLGSGYGEHELYLHLKGYDITASDLLIEPLLITQRFFPKFKVRFMDIFDPQLDFQWDDVLITGMDSYFDDFNTKQIFKNCQRLLGGSNKGKRLIFVLRYNDNLITKIIDELLLPMEAGLRNIKLKMSNGAKVYSRKFHGYRRSRKEILKIAEKCGFKLGRVFYAGFGIELERSTILQKIPFFIKLAKKVDRYIRVCNNATIFEFLYQSN